MVILNAIQNILQILVQQLFSNCKKALIMCEKNLVVLRWAGNTGHLLRKFAKENPVKLHHIMESKVDVP